MREERKLIAACFLLNGYTREADLDRRRQEGSQTYRKGYEVRFVLESMEDIELLRAVLIRAGLKPGKAFLKNKRYVQPVYGLEAVREICSWADKLLELEARAR